MSHELRTKLLIAQPAVTLFAEAVGDPNPIHQDKEIAQQMGLVGPIAHGMFVYSYLMERLDEWIKNQKQESAVDWNIKSTRCRFHEPAIIGNSFESVVQLVEQKDNEAKVDLSLFDDQGKKFTQVLVQIVKA